MTVGTRIQHRRDTAANWTTANPVLLVGEPALETDTGKQKVGDGVTAWTSLAYAGGSDPTKSPLLTPTATKTAAYTAVVGDLAMMNVPGGATALALPTAPADKAQVGYRAIGATTAVPLVVTAGGSDTIGTAGATTASIPLSDEVSVLQYQASGTRWLGVANVKTQASLDARFAPLVEAVNVVAASGATQTIPDPAVQSVSRITLTANCTLTFPTAVAGKSFTVVLVQDATGSRLVTYPATVRWPSGAAPVLSTGANKIDYLSFMSTDGTNWAGFAAGLDMR